jgi:hypothetical protein
MTARFLLHLRRWEHKTTFASYDAGEEFGSSRFKPNILGRPQSLIDDFGEDPVRRAQRESRLRREANARSTNPEIYEHDLNDRGEGSSSMV